MARLRALALDVNDLDRMCTFWAGVLEAEPVEVQAEGVSFSLGGDLTLDLLPVPEPKRVKDRLHLDLVAGGERSGPEEVERLLALGAVRADVGQGTDATWAVLADPEGNEFCVLGGADSRPSD